jgi:four helix bundle protein
MVPGEASDRRISTHRELVVWQKAMALAERCCVVAWTFPPRAYALASHIQKTAVAIPSNVAEGHELQTGSYRFHVRVALGSVAELDTQLELARRLKLLPSVSIDALAADLREIERMLRALGAALRRHAEGQAP